MDSEVARRAEAVFRVSPAGASLREMAERSSAEFVRTQYQLSIALPHASGFRLKALEAFDQYGWAILSGLADYHSVPLVERDGEPFLTLNQRATDLGLQASTLLQALNWNADDRRAFHANGQLGFRKLDQLASLVGLRSRDLGRDLGATRDDVGARLRTLVADKDATLTAGMVIAISEASRQIVDHEDLVRESQDVIELADPSLQADDCSAIRSIAEFRQSEAPWNAGFRAADLVRERLRIPPGEPVRSVSKIIEEHLNVLLVTANESENFSGCAIQREGRRGVLINLAFGGGDIVVQRSALAHELGHLLADSDAELSGVRVDQDRIFDETVMRSDRVESRANAFSAQFLAPQREVVRMFDIHGRDENAAIKVMEHFGVSRAVVKWQISNGLSLPAGSNFLRSAFPRAVATMRWIARENGVSSKLSTVVPSVAIIRRNKSAILASKLYSIGRISSDRLHSVLGYAEGDPKKLAKKILSVPQLDRMYRVR